jgi:biopolymer transport protein ExbD
MALKRQSRSKAEFSMSSLTDIIFLLLIFFMLTSSFVTPNALKLMLPKATNKTMSKQSVRVSITPDIKYYVNEEQVSEARLEQAVRNQIPTGQQDPAIVVSADRSVPVRHIVEVMMIGKKLQAKVVLATKPEK